MSTVMDCYVDCDGLLCRLWWTVMSTVMDCYVDCDGLLCRL
jgi:hypothetical protein